MKQRSWLAILLSFAGPCREAGFICNMRNYQRGGGFVPYLGVYEILRLFIHQSASGTELLRWAGVCLAGYAVKVAFTPFQPCWLMCLPTQFWRVCAVKWPIS
ncbi:MAG: hypothetical protein ACLVD8_26140 [Enterocloster sp.]|uniref:hypothetical protein n=1 Tax=Enterocloster sp. TaxID=2719315 RepID=UPI00399B1010